MVRDFRKLSVFDRRGARDSSPHASLIVAAVLIIAGLGAGSASADVRESTDLSGTYVAIGPLGSAVHVEGAWSGGFGGELTFARVNERRRLLGLGLSLGALQYTERSGGRIWADLFASTRTVFGVATGVSLGAVVEVDQVRPGRWGGQATLWVYSGVIPYLRVGSVQRGGAFVDVGLKIPLPALRW